MTAEHDLVAAYTAYEAGKKSLAAKIDALKEETISPLFVSFGRAVEAAQAEGLSIAEIGRIIDVKYRNFIYDAKRAAARERGEEPEVRRYVRRSNQEADTVTEHEQDAPDYTIDKIADDMWEVTAFGESFILDCDEDTGRLVIPDEWATASDHERDVYRTIMREIEASK